MGRAAVQRCPGQCKRAVRRDGKRPRKGGESVEQCGERLQSARRGGAPAGAATSRVWGDVGE